MFAGDRADLAKIHALRVARAFLERLQGLPTPDEPAPTPGALTITQHRPSER